MRPECGHSCPAVWTVLPLSAAQLAGAESTQGPETGCCFQMLVFHPLTGEQRGKEACPLCLEPTGVSLGCRSVCGSYLKCSGVPHSAQPRFWLTAGATVAQVGAALAAQLRGVCVNAAPNTGCSHVPTPGLLVFARASLHTELRVMRDQEPVPQGRGRHVSPWTAGIWGPVLQGAGRTRGMCALGAHCWFGPAAHAACSTPHVWVRTSVGPVPHAASQGSRPWAVRRTVSPL